MWTLTFLHLSDLRMQSPCPERRVAMLDAMCRDVREQSGQRGIDFVVVAGDIAFSGAKTEYDQAAQFFDKLLSGAELLEDRLFVVPGNHDVSPHSEIVAYLRQVTDSEEAVTELLADRSIVGQLLARFDAYREFLDEYLQSPLGEDSVYPVNTLYVSGLHVAVLGLNSALFSVPGKDDEGNLFLGEREVQAALRLASEADLRIAACHHPLHWLREFDRCLVEPLLVKDCHFLLHGHHHDGKRAQLPVPDGQTVVLSTRGHVTREGDSLTYNIIHLDFVKGEGMVEIRRYRPDSRDWGPGELRVRDFPAGRFPLRPPKWPTSKLEPTTVPSTAVAARVFHNLPQPDYIRFVGRERELAQVEGVVRRYLHPPVAIVGAGGIGKSALALELAWRYLRRRDMLPPEERFDAIIWASARPTVLTADGVVSRQAVTSNLDEIYTTIAYTLDREDIMRAPAEEQDDLLMKALSQQRTLLVLDNLETVDDERVNAFLRELPSTTSVLVTARHRSDVGYTVHLGPLSHEDALALIRQEGTKMRVTLTESEATKLYEHTGGVPLALVWSIAQMAYGYDAEAVLRHLSEANGDLLLFCFERSVEAAGKQAQQVLMALSLFSRDASRESVGYVAGLGGDSLTLDEALAQLQKLSLVSFENGRLSMLPVTKVYAAGRLAQEQDFERDARQRWVDWYLDFVRGIGPEEHAHFSTYDRLDVERENLLGVLSWCLMQQDVRGVEILLRTARYLYVRGFWRELERLCQGWISLAREQEQVEVVIQLLLWLGRLAERRSCYPDAMKYLLEGIRLAEQEGDLYRAAQMSSILGQAHFGEGRFDEAMMSLEHSTELAEARGDIHQAVMNQQTLGEIALARGQIERAQNMAQAALKQARRADLQGAVGYSLSLLGDINRTQQDLLKARSFYLNGLTKAQDWGDKFLIARLKARLAFLEDELGNRDKAVPLAQEARDLFSDLGIEQETQKLEAMLRHAGPAFPKG